MSLIPKAVYNAPDVEPLGLEPGAGPHTTDGKTTQISDFVINAGGEDKDKPSVAKDTELGQLRARLTTLQDKINIFLTDRMKQAQKSGDTESVTALEKKILDDGEDSEED